MVNIELRTLSYFRVDGAEETFSGCAMYNISVPVDAQLLQQWRNTTFNETGNTELHTSLSQHESLFNVFTI